MLGMPVIPTIPCAHDAVTRLLELLSFYARKRCAPGEAVVHYSILMSLFYKERWLLPSIILFACDIAACY
jgi:hypothetical protein